ncbi:MAG TPA: hypothetical protein VII63_06945 [Caulobacteraceae bacterium]
MVFIASAFVLAAGAVSVPTPAVLICNAMKVDLTELTVDGPERVTPSPIDLHPGRCKSVRGLTPGAHVIRFIERSEANAALCTQTVSATPGGVVRISPDDVAHCLR